jgi:hypothetical protein
VLFDDGDYQSSETPAQKTGSRLKDKLWQAIERKKSSYPLVNDDETPGATAEQVRRCKLSKRLSVHCLATRSISRCLLILSRFSRHAQIEDVAEWLAEMGRRADWMSNEARSCKSVVDVEAWETHRSTNKAKEDDHIAARKHRLIALFRSEHCYSANVHACKYGLGELVESLVQLDRLPAQTSAEGLRLLVLAWDEHRCMQKGWLSRDSLHYSGRFHWLHRAARLGGKCMSGIRYSRRFCGGSCLALVL